MKTIVFILIGFALAACTHSPPKKMGLHSQPPTSRQPACGPIEGEKLQINSDPKFARALLTTPLVCKIGDSFSEGALGEFAIYRCLDSPTKISLKTFGQSREVSSLTEKTSGEIEVTSTSVSTEALFTLDRGDTVESSEKISCYRKDAFNSGTNQILKIGDFDCQQEIVNAIWSVTVSDFHKKNKAKGVFEVPGMIKFEVQKGQNKNEYMASNFTMDGKTLPNASGSTIIQPTDKGCKIVSAKGSFN